MDEHRGRLGDFGYEIEELVSGDGWGRLYRARYAPHDTPVLLRVFPEALQRSEGAWDLLQAEIQAWARLDHPGIIPVLDWERLPGVCYCATVLPGGAPLCALLSEDSGVENPEEVLQPLVHALEAARSMGVLHLGLSTSNIWVEGRPRRPGAEPEGAAPGADGPVTASRGGPRVVVGEFGFWYAAREFPELGISGAEFPAPEQAADGRASSASDVYALGLLAVAMGHGLGAARACAGGASPPPGANPALATCLEADPLARSRSAGHLAQAMGFAPADEPCGRLECPMCRLKEQVRRERTGGRSTSATARDPAARAGCVWAMIAVTLVLAALVWWMALR